MASLSVTVRYKDSEGKDIVLWELPWWARKIGETFDSYWFIWEDFLKKIPQAAMSIVAEGRKNNQHEWSIKFVLKTRDEVLQLLRDNWRGKLLVWANPENNETVSAYWVSDQIPPTISPDLRQLF